MSEKWTKGPWKVGCAIVDGDSVTAVFNSDGDEICNFGNTLLDEDAHAKIIATAPKMYAVLKELCDSCMGECGDCNVSEILKEARGEA